MKPWQKLLRWFDREGRKLPWRGTRDPYRILVSEIMLQQTQVSRVIDFYRAWMKRFPTWNALAKASNAEIIHSWAGLGYNRRGLALRDIAKHVVHDGVPKSREAWLALKGIGPYTADALATFSLHERRWPIDTNLRRVGGRLWLGKPYPQPVDDERIRKYSASFIQHSPRFYDLPQAAFDLATSICTKTPACSMCPMKDDCLAAPKFLSGKVKTPKQMVKKSIERIHHGKKFPDRIYRGRILKAVRERSAGIDIDRLGQIVDDAFDNKQDMVWLEQMVQRLVQDHLVSRSKQRVTLPR
ncbi:A/G-specific adenine glycosylase [Candidatus Uhrbacteria bacterium]|nr:A/G-specific adenine glycosylase [Candidatus Uhrbacteria bacterium]